jgi:hypothetical protein
MAWKLIWRSVRRSWPAAAIWSTWICCAVANGYRWPGRCPRATTTYTSAVSGADREAKSWRGPCVRPCRRFPSPCCPRIRKFHSICSALFELHYHHRCRLSRKIGSASCCTGRRHPKMAESSFHSADHPICPRRPSRLSFDCPQISTILPISHPTSARGPLGPPAVRCAHLVERNSFRSERNEFRSTLVAAVGRVR